MPKPKNNNHKGNLKGGATYNGDGTYSANGYNFEQPYLVGNDTIVPGIYNPSAEGSAVHTLYMNGNSSQQEMQNNTTGQSGYYRNNRAYLTPIMRNIIKSNGIPVVNGTAWQKLTGGRPWHLWSEGYYKCGGSLKKKPKNYKK